MPPDRNDHMLALAQKVADADTDNFVELIRIVGLNPARDLRFGDWSGVSFRDCDLRGFDFTGARLVDCDFSETLIDGARFDQAEIDIACPYVKLHPRRTNLRAAKDWETFLTRWQRAPSVPSDDHFSVGAVFWDAPLAPEMVVVPAGTFLMGSPDGSGGRPDEVAEPYRTREEGPRHLVTIAQPFAVSRFSVTVEERRAPWLRGRSQRRATKHQRWLENLHPDTDLSWDDATAYATLLARKTGKPYRLLSEAEWEYCCRATTTTAYSTGNNITRQQAKYDRHGTAQRGSFPGNAWGVFDMHGNVWDWCQDEWHSNYSKAPNDGSPWDTGRTRTRRVCRGGSWSADPMDLRSARRVANEPDVRKNNIGFRVARALT